MKTLLDELTDSIESTQDAICDMVDFNYFCEKYTGEILDWLEDNYPKDLIHRAERVERELEQERVENMTPKELEADESEFKANCGRE